MGRISGSKVPGFQSSKVPTVPGSRVQEFTKRELLGYLSLNLEPGTVEPWNFGTFERCETRHFGNSLQASTSDPQYSMHLARSIGPFPTTLAIKKSTKASTSRG